MGGIVIDGGKFNWNSKKFPLLSQPDPSYHGLNYAEALGSTAFCTRLRTQILRDYGACISPFNSFLLMQGLETLPLRLARHVENALAIAKFLEAHPQVSWVSYPGLPSHPDYAKALEKGFQQPIAFYDTKDTLEQLSKIRTDFMQYKDLLRQKK